MDRCRIGVLGAGGRMGRLVMAEALGTPGAELVAGADAGDALIGADLGELAGQKPIGILCGRNAADVIAAADVVIDFSSPRAARAHAEAAAEAGTALVLGTTGIGAEDLAAIRSCAARTAILVAANMSLGVNLLEVLVEEVARALGTDWDIEIVEMHHRHKIDAPSGTALALGRAAAAGRGVDLDAVAARGRDGETGARPLGAIGFASLRGGDVVGEHSVIFAGAAERIELTHKATDRRIFARGALRAALWLAGRPPGYYGIKDLLGLGGSTSP